MIILDGGETNSTYRLYARQVLTIKGSNTNPDLGEIETPKCEIAFFRKEGAGIHPHGGDFMVITVRCDDRKIKRVLIDQRSFVDILYLDVFKRFQLELDDLITFQGSLVGSSREQV